ncbi:MAG: hypothetical protein AAF489_03445 [Bacteroidota bacterium]
MKTRENRNNGLETVINQGGGCCGPAPVREQVQGVESSGCGAAPVVEEKTQFSGGCCG